MAIRTRIEDVYRYKLALLYHETGRVEEAVSLAKTLLTEKVKTSSR